MLVAGTGWSFTKLPTGFVPDEDQGYMFVNIQLPDAASLQRTIAVLADLDPIFKNTPGVANWLSISGNSLLSGTAGSNQGMAVVIFQPWDERRTPELSQESILRNLQQQFAKIEEAIVFGFIPPPIDGLGNASGFQLEVQDRGNAGYAELQEVTEDLVVAGNSQSGLMNLNSTFRANVPQLFAEIDRTKAKSMNVPLSAVFGTLQAYLGSAYVNDFTYQNRSYQVRVQAEAEFRAQAEDIQRLDVRDAQGNMVPLDTLVEVREEFGPAAVRRYNLYPSASVNGMAAPGYSSGQALELMEELADSRLPAAFGHEWTGISYQEKIASGGQTLIFALAIVFVFLVLAAQYESWTSPAAVIAIVPLAALGVVLALLWRGADNNTYTQIGIVLLIALASKNAILIVEFAAELRRGGATIPEAAINAAKLRFRAILMTAFSSILGFLPLLVATGAGAASRRAVGNAVVGGMTAATFFALAFVPTAFVIFQRLSEFRSRSSEAEPVSEPSHLATSAPAPPAVGGSPRTTGDSAAPPEDTTTPGSPPDAPGDLKM